MSTDTPTNTELRRMDETEAKHNLTVAEYERWESLNDHLDRADEAREQWEEDDAATVDITVKADMSDLATEVELYGNDVLVHMESDNSAIEDHIGAVDDILGDRDVDETATLTDDEKETAEGHMLDVLDEILVQWNGTRWADLSEAQRGGVLADIGREWGVDALLNAWLDIAVAVAEDREEKVSTIESFRSPERRGRR